jgi:hypothetical protein
MITVILSTSFNLHVYAQTIVAEIVIGDDTEYPRRQDYYLYSVASIYILLTLTVATLIFFIRLKQEMLVSRVIAVVIFLINFVILMTTLVNLDLITSKLPDQNVLFFVVVFFAQILLTIGFILRAITIRDKSSHN